ncbi:hypothetical protein SNE40_005949 [Patella caerulea]|uniref:Uncharacterized protein n=1 Tax=Patella caerulea TaxID=87958 RepID=A0AAN8K6G1_PATCE
MNGALAVGEEVLVTSINRILSSEANISSVNSAGFAKYSNCFVCLGQGSRLSVDPDTKVDFQTGFIGANTDAKNVMSSHSDWSPTTVLILKQVGTIRRCANFPMVLVVSDMSECSWVSCYTSAEISIQQCKKEIFATWLALGSDPLVAGLCGIALSGSYLAMLGVSLIRPTRLIRVRKCHLLARILILVLL